jgi:hypothetical protein
MFDLAGADGDLGGGDGFATTFDADTNFSNGFEIGDLEFPGVVLELFQGFASDVVRGFVPDKDGIAGIEGALGHDEGGSVGFGSVAGRFTGEGLSDKNGSGHRSGKGERDLLGDGNGAEDEKSD